MAMTLDEYKSLHQDLKLGVLCTNHSHFDALDKLNSERNIKKYNNYRAGILIFSLVSFIESNFLDSKKMKSLRKFEYVVGLPSGVNQKHLSCFIYIRDCVAHNMFPKLFVSNTNSGAGHTQKFIDSTNNGDFPFVTVSGGDIILGNSLNDLHLIVLDFFDVGV